MSGWDGAGAIHAVRTRITKLDATGAPLVGTSSKLVSSALTKVSFTPQKSEGDEIEQKNGGGELCLYYKAPDTLKAIEIKIEVCSPDPELEQLLAGGTVITDATNPVGYAAPEIGVDPTPYGVSVEVWSRAIIDGAQATNLPWIHWVFPRERLSQDERTIENAAMLPAYTGTGQQNPAWGTGPDDDWTYESSRLWQWARVAALPAVTDGLAEVVAPTP